MYLIKMHSCKNTSYPRFRRGSSQRLNNLFLLSCLVGFCLISSTFSQNESSPSPKVQVQKFLENVKQLTQVHTCCDIDLTKEHSQCSKPSPGDEVIVPSKTIALLPHLVAENTTVEFKLKTKKGKCLPSDLETVHLSWKTGGSENPRLNLFLKNGYLKITLKNNEGENEVHFFHSDEYCINGKNQTTLEIKYCPQDCNGSRPCIFKCCGLDKLYSFAKPPGKMKGCVDPEGEGFNPSMFVDFMTKMDPTGTLAPHYIEKYPTSFRNKCHNLVTVAFVQPTAHKIMQDSGYWNSSPSPNEIPFRLKYDGNIIYKGADGKCEEFDPKLSHVCIDGIVNYGEKSPYTNSHDEQLLVHCSIDPGENRSGSSESTINGSYLYGGLMIVSCVFLLLTIIVYVLLWERQNVHGWTILSHTISLFFMYLFLGTSHLVGVTLYHHILNTTWCFTLGMLIHYFFLSTFCWLTMMSVDLWLTFRSGRRSKGFSRYVKYSVIGWGVPFIIVLVGWILSAENPIDSCIINKIITPAYGTESCYIQEKALGVYLYYPIAVKLGINLTFFAITSIKLFMYRDSTKMATKDDQNQQFYRLFFKLFFVIGVPYLFEVISWAVSGNGFTTYWVVFDVLNILRAVAVFIIFVCKPDILWALEQKYPCLKPVMKLFACIMREKREFARRQADSEFQNLNSSMSRSTKQSTMRSSSSAAAGNY